MAKSKEERDHLNRVAELGCVVCRLQHLGFTPAVIHHTRFSVGLGQRAHYSKTIPLCPPHHTDGGYGVAIHAGKEAWERKYGTEQELLEVVIDLLGG